MQWTVACQAPLSMGFFRQEHWSGLPHPSPRNLPTQGLNPRLHHWQAGSYDPIGAKGIVVPGVEGVGCTCHEPRTAGRGAVVQLGIGGNPWDVVVVNDVEIG